MDRIAVRRSFIWFAAVLVASVVVWLPASPAHACQAIDPSCVTGTGGDAAASANDAAPDDFAGAVDAMVKDVDDAADPVEGLVHTVEETARDAVDDIIGGTLPDLPGP